jgi:hypothetical protein
MHMRLIKLSKDDKDFVSEESLKYYFHVKLFTRTPSGFFVFPKRHIAANALDPDERILFSYQGNLRYVAKTKTGVEKNTHPLLGGVNK